MEMIVTILQMILIVQTATRMNMTAIMMTNAMTMVTMIMMIINIFVAL